MEIVRKPPSQKGVTSLMVVGDDGTAITGAAPNPLNKLLLGAAAAAGIAMVARSPAVKTGAGVAAAGLVAWWIGRKRAGI